MVRASARGLAGDYIRESWCASEVDAFSQSPALVFGCFWYREVVRSPVQRLRIAGMDHEPISPLERGALDFGHLDGAHMHAGLHPAFKEYVVDRIAGTHRDVGIFDGIFRLTNRFDLDAKHGAHVACKRFAATGIRAETADSLYLTHGAGRHELSTGVPARAENADAGRVLAREIFDTETVGCTDANALHDAIRQNRQRLAGLGREHQHQPDEAGIRVSRHLYATHVVALHRPRDDVGIDPDSPHTELRYDAVH